MNKCKNVSKKSVIQCKNIVCILLECMNNRIGCVLYKSGIFLRVPHNESVSGFV